MYIYELAKLMYKLKTKSLPTPILNHFETLKITTKTIKLTSGQKKEVT